MKRGNYKAPFLNRISFLENRVNDKSFPFNIPAFSNGINIQLAKRITFFVGENGSGKSTLLEAIATCCGFSLRGGNKNHSSQGQDPSRLSQSLRLSWMPKINEGFFMRAESFFNFASYIDELEKEKPGLLPYYGGKSLHAQSHGESFISLFKNRFGSRGIYILDEPEAALSPTRQLGFLSIINDLDRSEQVQFIIATHSPILLAYPGASILSMDGDSIQEIQYKETGHYQTTKSFLECPERFFKNLFAKAES